MGLSAGSAPALRFPSTRRKAPRAGGAFGTRAVARPLRSSDPATARRLSSSRSASSATATAALTGAMTAPARAPGVPSPPPRRLRHDREVSSSSGTTWSTGLRSRWFLRSGRISDDLLGMFSHTRSASPGGHAASLASCSFTTARARPGAARRGTCRRAGTAPTATPINDSPLWAPDAPAKATASRDPRERVGDPPARVADGGRSTNHCAPPAGPSRPPTITVTATPPARVRASSEALLAGAARHRLPTPPLLQRSRDPRERPQPRHLYRARSTDDRGSALGPGEPWQRPRSWRHAGGPPCRLRSPHRRWRRPTQETRPSWWPSQPKRSRRQDLNRGAVHIVARGMARIGVPRPWEEGMSRQRRHRAAGAEMARRAVSPPTHRRSAWRALLSIGRLTQATKRSRRDHGKHRDPQDGGTVKSQTSRGQARVEPMRMMREMMGSIRSADSAFWPAGKAPPPRVRRVGDEGRLPVQGRPAWRHGERRRHHLDGNWPSVTGKRETGSRRRTTRTTLRAFYGSQPRVHLPDG
jgi:hypothetical protein